MKLSTALQCVHNQISLLDTTKSKMSCRTILSNLPSPAWYYIFGSINFKLALSETVENSLAFFAVICYYGMHLRLNRISCSNRFVGRFNDCSSPGSWTGRSWLASKLWCASSREDSFCNFGRSLNFHNCSHQL